MLTFLWLWEKTPTSTGQSTDRGDLYGHRNLRKITNRPDGRVGYGWIDRLLAVPRILRPASQPSNPFQIVRSKAR
jgi:hypothetical protein